MVTNLIVGKVTISRVFPARDRLEARLTANLSYGPDPDSDCLLANTQFLGSTVATSTLNCHIGQGTSSCQGNLVLPALLPPQCSDVNLIMENIRSEVYEFGGVGIPTSLIARDGAKILGR